MTPELISLICGIIVFTIFMMFFSEEQNNSPVGKRLKDTKEKKFLPSRPSRNEEDLFKKIEAQGDNNQRANLLEMLKDPSEYRLYFLEFIFKRFEFTKKIKKLLKIADIKMPLDLFFMLSGGLFFPFLLIGIFSGSFLFIVIGIGFALLPYYFIKIKISKNFNQFNLYFPDALSLISNSLRAGHSLLASFQLVSNESPYPVNKLFKNVSDDISLGRDIREALEDMITQMPESEDMKFFITAVLIQKEIGGNLAEILDTLNTTIRERFKLLGMIKTQTAQAKMSGIILALAPVFITIVVSLINPAYMAPLFNTFIGNTALAISVGMSLSGYFIISKITQIRV